MKKIVIANWKMNPSKSSQVKKLVEDTKKISKSPVLDIVICPPTLFINLFSNHKKVFVGAQNVSFEKEGAFTGEISSSQLRILGVTHCIVGHSERRMMGETSEVVAKKVCACIESGIQPIVCIGEKVRDASAEHWQEIKWQIVDSLQGVTKQTLKKCIIAYEPIWTIGKKSHGSMSPEDVSESAIYIKKVLAEMFGLKIAEGIRIIYGGSVDSQSAKNIIESQDISGFLVGRASLNIKEFSKIIEAFR
jgi:triosephosphate isomerase